MVVLPNESGMEQHFLSSTVPSQSPSTCPPEGNTHIKISFNTHNQVPDILFDGDIVFNDVAQDDKDIDCAA